LDEASLLSDGGIACPYIMHSFCGKGYKIIRWNGGQELSRS